MEVVPAREGRDGARHPVDRESVLDPEDEWLPERGPAPGEPVAIRPEPGVVPGMETGRRLPQGEDVDVRGEQVVDVTPQPLGRARHEAGRETERSHLSEGVYPRVGPARAVHLDAV